MIFKKPVAFVYTGNVLWQKEIRTNIPFIVTFKKIKHLRTHLTKEKKGLGNKNVKTLEKEVKMILGARKIFHAPGLAELIP